MAEATAPRPVASWQDINRGEDDASSAAPGCGRSLSPGTTNDADENRERCLAGRPEGREGKLQGTDGTAGAVQLLVAVRERHRLQSRGAARRRRSGVLQHGAE